MYSLAGHGRMIADRGRVGAYAEALRRTVKPGSVVADLGAGAGIYSLLACRFGARLVHAVEPDNIIDVARQTAAANGFSDRIDFIQDWSTRVSLPQRVDVIVAEMRGVLPVFGHHITAIADARKRFLAPGGVLIPQRDTLWAAVVEAPELYGEYVDPWATSGYGFDLGAGRSIVLNTWRKERFRPDQLLTKPQCWATLDYNTIEDPDVQAELHWTATREGTGHGLCVWFDATLVDGVSFSNAPGAPELIYGSAFFPWSSPVEVQTGDVVTCAIEANLVGDDYVWRWESRVREQGDPARVRADFKQSTFLGTPLSAQQLRKRAASFRPDLNEEGRIDALVLGLMGSGATVGEIATRLQQEFPDRFTSGEQALTRAGELSLKYSR